MVNDFERLLATVIEVVLERDEGVILGPVSEHDFNDGIRSSVDFIYRFASPPIALEVTTVQHDSVLNTHSSASRLENRLSKLTKDEGLGSWHIVIWDDASVREMAIVLEGVLRAGEDIEVNEYSSEDLLRWTKARTRQQTLRLHAELSRVGVARAIRVAGEGEVFISTTGRSAEPWRGLDDVPVVLDANTAKLVTTGLEGHLAIGIGRFGVSTDPNATPVPTLPSGVERLWLIRLWSLRHVGCEVWSLRRGERHWTVHAPVFAAEPLGI
jgi:hypothetical protein